MNSPAAAPLDLDLPIQAQPVGMDPARRQSMIAEAAYFMAQARGFEAGRELDDWLEAEWELDQRLAQRDFDAALPDD